MKKNLIYFCLILLIIKSNVYAQSHRYPPVDESKKDKSLVAFVAKIKKAIQEKNAASFISLLDKNVNLSFGGDHGISDFKKMWHPEKSTSELWPLLKKIVDLGGVFLEGPDSFVFPYVFGIELDTLDAFDVYVVIGKNSEVKQKPLMKSKTVGTLSYDLVKGEIGEDKTENWLFVKTLDRKIKGYVKRESLWSPIDYRMLLTKEDGVWKITSLVAGD